VRRLAKLGALIGLLAQVGWGACTPGTNGTSTARVGLYEPPINECGWGTSLNNNFTILDSSMCIQSSTNTFTQPQYFTTTLIMKTGNQENFNSGNNSNWGFITNPTISLPALQLQANQGIAVNSFPYLSTVSLMMYGGLNQPYGSIAVAASSISYSGFIATSPITQSTLWSLPTADGTANQLLKTDGSSHLSFTNNIITNSISPSNQSSPLVISEPSNSFLWYTTNGGLGTYGPSEDHQLTCQPVGAPSVCVRNEDILTVPNGGYDTLFAPTIVTTTSSSGNDLGGMEIEPTFRDPYGNTGINHDALFIQPVTSMTTAGIVYGTYIAPFDQSTGTISDYGLKVDLSNVTNSHATKHNAYFVGGGDVSISSNTILPGATFYQGAPTAITQVNSPFFGNANGQSIYGNFIASTTVTSASSMTVTVSGYNHYKLRVQVSNATGVVASVFMRLSQDGASHYGYSNSGFDNGVSTGSFCALTTANAMAFSVTGSTNGWNNVNTQGLYALTADINIDAIGPNNTQFLNGTVQYVDQNAITVNLDWAGTVQGGSLSSIQVWVGTASNCTTMTDPLTGTTGTMEVWGVF
jgi:hypothetical protein